MIVSDAEVRYSVKKLLFVLFPLRDSRESESYVLTFRNILSIPSS